MIIYAYVIKSEPYTKERIIMLRIGMPFPAIVHESLYEIYKEGGKMVTLEDKEKGLVILDGVDEFEKGTFWLSRNKK